ncbi:hypothetical protein C8R45DRAFT_1107631 [Mycena sanguinolenta]|nr:hypothetical protein C8R45DRAFT_1107631 [Mycena sanguinolenta]
MLTGPAFTYISGNALAAAATSLPQGSLRSCRRTSLLQYPQPAPVDARHSTKGGAERRAAQYPTHLLAISAPPSKSSHSSWRGAGGEVKPFPVHAVILAAHYAKLPPLLFSRHSPSRDCSPLSLATVYALHPSNTTSFPRPGNGGWAGTVCFCLLDKMLKTSLIS